MHSPAAILLMGATATGKTDLAVRLAEKFPVEIISVDSALIYRGMNIGTAKPDAELLQRAPHYLIDIIDPSQRWSAWNFVDQAEKLIGEINSRGNIPLLAGGTMMYFRALEQGLNQLPMADDEIRAQLNIRLQEQGLESLYAELMLEDPQTAERLNSTDTQRILRALEVKMITGIPMSELIQTQATRSGINYKRLILDVPERVELHQRIEKRFHSMLALGFEQEVAQLRERRDLDLTLPSMRCVGYRQMWMYLDGNFSYSDMVNKSVVATRQLAKRQLTWLRKYEDVKRIDYRDYHFSDVCQYLDIENS